MFQVGLSIDVISTVQAICPKEVSSWRSALETRTTSIVRVFSTFYPFTSLQTYSPKSAATMAAAPKICPRYAASSRRNRRPKTYQQAAVPQGKTVSVHPRKLRTYRHSSFYQTLPMKIESRKQGPKNTIRRLRDSKMNHDRSLAKLGQRDPRTSFERYASSGCLI